MLLKAIELHIKPEHFDAFSATQSHWQALKQVEGFLGQFGGKLDHDRYLIIGLWHNHSCYQGFINGEHDAIYDSSGQQELIESIKVTLYGAMGDSARLRLLEQLKQQQLHTFSFKPLSSTEVGSQQQLDEMGLLYFLARERGALGILASIDEKAAKLMGNAQTLSIIPAWSISHCN
ncbi:DUF4937 domain-containing protein [Paraferrimonas sp. SM1919]|uniref:DUF4937 domain-containing protein n=1 Tax=Paraferrimonas sp. SM1919 TaxID=2662263 RepID=UPI0013CF40DA|nr:DUF4937 domain-containing protein [Paraferrimonas sp. SM1919]